MNGAGVGGRLVSNRRGGTTLGNREQRRNDLRYAFRNMGTGLRNGASYG